MRLTALLRCKTINVELVGLHLSYTPSEDAEESNRDKVRLEYFFFFFYFGFFYCLFSRGRINTVSINTFVKDV